MSESASTRPPSDYAPDQQSPVQRPDNRTVQASIQPKNELPLPPLDQLPVVKAQYADTVATGERHDPAIAYFENTLPSILNTAPFMNHPVQPAQFPGTEPNRQIFLQCQSQLSPSVPLPRQSTFNEVKERQRLLRLQRFIILKERRRFKKEQEAAQTLTNGQKNLTPKRKYRRKQPPKETETTVVIANRNFLQKRDIREATGGEGDIQPQPPRKRRGRKPKNISGASQGESTTVRQAKKSDGQAKISAGETSNNKGENSANGLQETNSKQNNVSSVPSKDSANATENIAVVAQKRNVRETGASGGFSGMIPGVPQATSMKVAEGLGDLKQTSHAGAANADTEKAVTAPSKEKPAQVPSKDVEKGISAVKQKASGKNSNLGILQNVQIKKIAALEKQVIELKWALLKSAAPAGSENGPREELSAGRRVKCSALETIEIASITEAWSRAVPENPPWEIRSKISATAQTRGQLSLQCLYNHVLEAIDTGTAPPCDATFHSLREGIISTFKAASKADFAHTPQHATVAFAMSKMTQAFLNNVFSRFLKAPSSVDMSWGIALVKNIITPILQYAKSESRIIYGDVGKCCAKAICDSALSLSTEERRAPLVQVELSVRAIELSTAILTTEEKQILSQISTETVCAIGSRNILFSLRFAALK